MTDSIRRGQAHAAATNSVCRIRLPRIQSMAVAAACCDTAVTHVAIDSLCQWRAVTNLPAVSSILVMRPQARFELNCLEYFDSDLRLIWAIDHFAQAEVLVENGSRAPTIILIRLQNSSPGIGIRPGMDAAQLAQGVRQLSGIRVGGLLFDAADGKSAVQAAQSTRDRVLMSDIEGSELCVRLSVGSALSDGDAGSEFIVDTCAADQVDSAYAADCTAEVISRPSLAYVVIAIPETELIGRPLEFPDIPEAMIAGWCDDCCVIHANGGAARLTIGDSVTVRAAMGRS